MTINPTDLERIRKRVEVAERVYGGGTATITASEARALLDALEEAEAHAALWKETARHILHRSREWLDAARTHDLRERRRIHNARTLAEAQVRAVRELHARGPLSEVWGPGTWPILGDTPVCQHCTAGDGMDMVRWPCDTIRALED